MQLRLKTDLALRTLLYLGHWPKAAARAGDDPGRVSAETIAQAFEVSKEHIVKVVQELARHGWVATRPGRGGGIRLVVDPAELTVADVVEAFEGRQGVLECVASPEVCVLEPGCGLRRLLIDAESAFFETLASKTLAELLPSRGRKGGLLNLNWS